MSSVDKKENGGGGDEEIQSIPRANHSVPIHSLVESSQSSHGLRHSDYAQYRSYCTRRLSRLRHATDVRKELSHGGKGGGGGGGTQQQQPSRKGGRHAFQPRRHDAEDSNKHLNYVLVSLYQAERAWSHSMEIKALYDAAREERESAKKKKGKMSKKSANPAVDKLLSGDKKRSGPSKIRSHQLRRLRKAASFASELERRAQASCDNPTALEARAYASWMRGNLALEKGEWRVGAEEYGESIRICGELVEMTSGVGGAGSEGDGADSGEKSKRKKEDLERGDYFHARAEHVIEPLLRYCRYEMQEGGTDPSDILALKDADDSLQLKSKLESLRTERLRNQASGGRMSTVEFRGRDVPVENETLRVALIRAADLKSDLEEKEKEGGEKEGNEEDDNDAKFLSLLSTYDDAAAIATDDLREYEGMKAGPAVNARRRDAEMLLGYVKYQKLRLLMRRNERMVEALRGTERTAATVEADKKDKDSGEAAAEDAKRSEEIAHLYDALLQDARAVAALPSASEDGAGEEEEDEFALEADANVLRIRALRSYYMARLYNYVSSSSSANNSGSGGHAEAAALLCRARSLSVRAAEEIAACSEMEDQDARMEAMTELGNAIEAEMCRTRAGAFLAERKGGSAGSKAQGAGAVPFLRRLDDFDAYASCGDPPANLVPLPPPLEPVPCRPTFFDVALNHVGEFPHEELSRLVDAHKEKPKSSGGGLLGWFSRG